MCRDKADHRWPRRASPDYRDCRLYGYRDIITCNDCMAIKVTFRTVQSNGEFKTETVIVEPSQ